MNARIHLDHYTKKYKLLCLDQTAIYKFITTLKSLRLHYNSIVIKPTFFISGKRQQKYGYNL